MFIKPANKICKLKIANVIGGGKEHKNYPINLSHCSQIEDETWNISGVTYYSIYFKGIDSMWLYVKKEDRDEEFKLITDRL